MVSINCILMRVQITTNHKGNTIVSTLTPNTEYTALTHSYTPLTPLTTPPPTPGLAPLLFLTGPSLGCVIAEGGGDLLL